MFDPGIIFDDGYKAGYDAGYEAGIRDAIKVIQQMALPKLPDKPEVTE